MRFLGRKSWAVLFLLATVLGCSKPETKLIGTWTNEKTASSMEFRSDNTGVIHQNTNPKLPADIPFKWSMLDKNEFRVEAFMPGNTEAPAAQGRIEGKDTMVLGEDSFKKTK